MSNKIASPFIAVSHKLFDCKGLDLYHSTIISWIYSYQRQGQPFFMSKAELAEKFGCDKKTVYRRFDELEEFGIIYKDGKHKRSFKYKVDSFKLDRYLRGTHFEKRVPERYSSQEIGTSEGSYNNNNKTSNKTSFRDEDDILSSSPSQPDFNAEAFEAFMNEMDI